MGAMSPLSTLICRSSSSSSSSKRTNGFKSRSSQTMVPALGSYIKTRRIVRRTRGDWALSLALLCCWAVACLLPLEQTAEASVNNPAFVASSALRQAVPPFVALTLGFVAYALSGGDPGIETVSVLLIYFGAQTGMNLYMKSVLSKIVVDEEEGLRGVPIGFLLTAIQQLVAFVAFSCFLVIGKLFSGGYQVKKLTTLKEYGIILCFSMAFALNIGLNNFSLSLVALSINMIIRSCLPLSTALSQLAVGSCLQQSGNKKNIKPVDWLLMLLGVGFAVMVTRAKSGGGEESAALGLGVACCIASLFSGALNMVLAGVLGTEMKLNPLDTTCYMSLPASLLLLLPAMFVKHPLGHWPGFPAMTDWQVLLEVAARSPWALLPVMFSGVLAFLYNILQYTLVHRLSASHAAFAGNFNKAATVALSLLLGLESLPAGWRGQLFIFGVVGNIGTFTIYSALKVKK